MSIRHPSDEHLVRVASCHWIVYVFPYFLFTMLLGIALFLMGLAATAALQGSTLAVPAFWAGLLLLLAVQHWFFLYLMSDSLGYVLVTSRRVIVITTKLLVQETMQEISFEKMKTVSAVKKGFLQNVLTYGTLMFEGGTTVSYIAHPNSVVKDIQQAMGMN